MKKSILSLILVFGVVSLLQAEFVRDNSKEVVVDKSTNLMWQDDNDANSVIKTWVEAINYCENLTLGGYTDWRLPNINELESIVDYTKTDPAISSEFSNVDSDNYWSSSSFVGYSAYAWLVDFYHGLDDVYYKSDSFFVRCVRDNN